MNWISASRELYDHKMNKFHIININKNNNQFIDSDEARARQ